MSIMPECVLRGLASLCLLGLVACSGPTYKTRYYTLVADHQARALLAGDYAASVGVGPVRLPEMLDRPGIVSRADGQRLEVAPYDIWAGDIEQAITRVMADNLSSYLATDQVWPFPWDNRVRPARQIGIVLERFGGERGGEVVLQAKWRLLSTDGSEQLYAEKVTLRTEAGGNSYNAYVGALNDLLNQLSAEIARALAARAE